MKREYEYEIVKVKPEWSGWRKGFDFDVEKINETINEYGNDGWELLRIIPSTQVGTTHALLFVFKKTHQW